MNMKPNANRKRLGDMLVEAGVITTEQLRQALDIQKHSGGKLGVILARIGALNEELVLGFLGRQCGVSYISLAEYGEIPPDTIRSIPESIIRSQNLIPIRKEGNAVTVAMADPFNLSAIDDIRLITGYDVQAAIASEGEITSAIERYYSHELNPRRSFILSDESGAAVSDEEALGAFLSQSIAGGASAVYLEPQQGAQRVRLRIDGYLFEKSQVSQRLFTQLINGLKTAAGLGGNTDPLPKEGHMRVTADGRETALRVSLVPTVFGEKAVLTILHADNGPRDLCALGFEPDALSLYRRFIESPKGLALVAGPARGGKTTTLYSTLASLNFPDRDIVTIEDPVEMIIPGISQVQLRPREGFTYASDLQVFLRQNPDVVMAGEIKDRESAGFALQSALGGRTVFSSIIARSGFHALATLRNLGMDPFLVSTSLLMLVYQRLMRTICPECRETYELGKNHVKGIGLDLPLPEDSDRLSFKRGKGCPACNYTGYRGRTGVFEVMPMTDELRALIACQAPEQELRRSAAAAGYVTLQEAAWHKVLNGVSTIEEMLAVIKF